MKITHIKINKRKRKWGSILQFDMGFCKDRNKPNKSKKASSTTA